MTLPPSNNGKQKIRSVNIYMAELTGHDWSGGWLEGLGGGGWGDWQGLPHM